MDFYVAGEKKEDSDRHKERRRDYENRNNFYAHLIGSCAQKKVISKYCKRGNIRGALIFAENSSSANSKTRENIYNILYAHLDM